jgi:hypothetical protein
MALISALTCTPITASSATRATAGETSAAIDADFEVHRPEELDDYLDRVGRRFRARHRGR